MDCYQEKTILYNSNILSEIRNGHIMIKSFNEENLGDGSYDVMLE